jgi:antitoxin ParD1/3/4
MSPRSASSSMMMAASAEHQGRRTREILPGGFPLPYIRVMDEMRLPPELESFAAEAVAEGRYRDRTELVAAGVALLRERDAARAAFLASVLAAEEEADRDGCVSGAEMLARVRARLADRHSAAV